MTIRSASTSLPDSTHEGELIGCSIFLLMVAAVLWAVWALVRFLIGLFA